MYTILFCSSGFNPLLCSTQSAFVIVPWQLRFPALLCLSNFIVSTLAWAQFLFLGLKAFSWIIFSVIFRVSDHQLVEQKNED